LRTADQDGLKPEDYHLATLQQLVADIRRIRDTSDLPYEKLTDLDLLLTDALLTFGSHTLHGRFNPSPVQSQASAERQQTQLVDTLRMALETGRVSETLRDFRPPQPGYDRLRQALAQYRALASRGGWPHIAAGPPLQMGDRDPRVRSLRQRLRTAGEVSQAAWKDPKDADLFDDVVDKALRRFQQAHGLEVDGVLGQSTLAALNVSAEARGRQIAANMERWRWLPHHMGQRYILVNITRFALEVIEEEKPVLTMRIIVGKPYQSTPEFNAAMTHLVVNPSWYVPPSIAKAELLPVLRRDPGYLVRQNMRVYQGSGVEVDPSSINWPQVSATNFPYRLRQVPGPKNPLGRIKFLFPNPFSVYLHDTSNPELFAKNIRTFSHGCIRIEKPIDLAEYVLRGNPRWSRAKILAAIARRQEQAIALPVEIPVYLVYWTAWVDEAGLVHFRDDIYQRDNSLVKGVSGTVQPL
jgi:murein L,D-transpeptidase YcbB/YkuD